MGYFQVTLRGEAWCRVPCDWTGVAFPSLGIVVHAPHRVEPHLTGMTTVTRLGSHPENIVTSPFLVLEDPREREDVHDVLPLLLDRLRFASGQSSIPRGYASIRGPSSGLHPESSAHDFSDTDIGYNQLFYPKAITAEHCELAAGSDELPAPYLFLIDAADAVLNDDFRRAIIYAAIAAESVSKFGADEAEGLAQRERTSDPTLRFAQMKPVGNWKDSVVERLRKNEKFLDLVSVVSLYLRGRSLPADHPETYRRATALYKTRSKLVHEAIAPIAGEFLPLSRDGAYSALATAIDVFEWWGFDAKRFAVATEAFPSD